MEKKKEVIKAKEEDMARKDRYIEFDSNDKESDKKLLDFLEKEKKEVIKAKLEEEDDDLKTITERDIEFDSYDNEPYITLKHGGFACKLYLPVGKSMQEITNLIFNCYENLVWVANLNRLWKLVGSMKIMSDRKGNMFVLTSVSENKQKSKNKQKSDNEQDFGYLSNGKANPNRYELFDVRSDEYKRGKQKFYFDDIGVYKYIEQGNLKIKQYIFSKNGINKYSENYVKFLKRSVEKLQSFEQIGIITELNYISNINQTGIFQFRYNGEEIALYFDGKQEITDEDLNLSEEGINTIFLYNKVKEINEVF